MQPFHSLRNSNCSWILIIGSNVSLQFKSFTTTFPNQWFAQGLRNYIHIQGWFPFTAPVMKLILCAGSRFAPSQWETALLCNDVSHWLGASLESALCANAATRKNMSKYIMSILSELSFWYNQNRTRQTINACIFHVNRCIFLLHYSIWICFMDIFLWLLLLPFSATNQQ